MTASTSNISLLQLYFGDPYQVSDKILIFQPTIG